MKNIKKFIIPFIIPLILSACNSPKKEESESEESGYVATEEDVAAIKKELKGCFRYFMGTTNLNDESSGFGLAQDRLSNKNLSSIAATGFLLACYPVFVEQGLMEKENATNIVNKTMDTLIRIQNDSETSYEGCMSHFVNMQSGKRFDDGVEISTIDTAILVSGAISAGEYFEGEIKEKATTLWSNVNYKQFSVTKNGKSYISMGVKSPSNHAQLSPWDYYAEQLMIHILGAGNPNAEHRIGAKYYKSITKELGTYNGVSHIYSWFGSLFTYQFSHAFYNFKNYNDYKGINYFDNSVNASITAYDYCQDRSEYYKSFSENSWGLTACDTPIGYSGELGTPPRGFGGNSVDYLRIEGTVAPTAAIGSMPFTPEKSIKALRYYQSINGLDDAYYGLRDAFNFDFNGSRWIAPDMIGIDKGIEVLQIANYLDDDFVSNLAMKNPYVIEGFTNNEFVEVKDEI